MFDVEQKLYLEFMNDYFSKLGDEFEVPEIVHDGINLEDTRDLKREIVRKKMSIDL